MRFYTRRCHKDFRTEDEQAELEELRDLESAAPEQRMRYDALHTRVSDHVEILDGNNTVLAFNVHESDAEYVCAALNAADRQEKLCSV